MELTRFAVIAYTAIVVKAIGGVGVFLYLCQQDALADGVNGAGWNKENIAFFTGAWWQISVIVPFFKLSASS